jgi:hypothetical protein
MCDTVVSVSEERVLLAKHSDRDPNEAQVLEWHPRRSYGPESTVRCTWIEIAKVPETFAVLISRPFWMWGAEMGANEHGVAIGNEAVFTTEPYAPSGLTGMDLLRLALERAASAEAAVSVITGLLDRYGQGGGCGHERRSFTYHNSFAIADPSEAWILETAGARWATERVSAGVRTISNGLTIPQFAHRYGDRVKTTVCASAARRQLTARHAGEHPQPHDLMSVLRSHGRGRWPRYRLANGAMAAPCMHAGGALAATRPRRSDAERGAALSLDGHRGGRRARRRAPGMGAQPLAQARRTGRACRTLEHPSRHRSARSCKEFVDLIKSSHYATSSPESQPRPSRPSRKKKLGCAGGRARQARLAHSGNAPARPSFTFGSARDGLKRSPQKLDD